MAVTGDFSLPSHPYREYVAVERSLSALVQQEAELILHFQQDRITYGVRGAGGEWYCLRTYQNTGLLSEPSFFRLIFAKDHYLRNHYRKIRTYFSESPFTLIPERLDIPDFRLSIARLLLGEDLFEEDMIHTHVADWDLSVLSHFRPEWQQVMADHKLGSEARPVMSSCLAWASRWKHEHEQYLSLWVQREYMMLIAVAQGNLLLANTFSHRSTADMLYFVQAVRDELPQPARNIPVMVPTGHLHPRQLEEWPAYGLKPMLTPIPRGPAMPADMLIYLLAADL